MTGVQTCALPISLLYDVYRPGTSAYEAVQPDSDGFKHSAVFDTRFQLTRCRNAKGRWVFDLRRKDG